MLTLDFFPAVALDFLRPGIPGQDEALRIERIDRVIDDRFNEQFEELVVANCRAGLREGDYFIRRSDPVGLILVSTILYAGTERAGQGYVRVDGKARTLRERRRQCLRRYC